MTEIVREGRRFHHTSIADPDGPAIRRLANGVWQEITAEEAEIVSAWDRPVIPIFGSEKALVLVSDYAAVFVTRECRKEEKER